MPEDKESFINRLVAFLKTMDCWSEVKDEHGNYFVSFHADKDGNIVLVTEKMKVEE